MLSLFRHCGPGGTQTTSASGVYSFANLPAGGNYTVTFSLANHTFALANAEFSNLQAGKVSNFIGSGPLVTSLRSDFNGDGHADVIFQDSVSGWAQVRFLGGPQGTTIVKANNLALRST